MCRNLHSMLVFCFFFFSSRRRHTRYWRDWSSDVCSSDLMILRGLRDTLEAHHKVTITEEAITAAAELSDRYVTGRFLPDKAIDLIDQAAARVKISATARPVDVQELEAEVRQLKREQDYAASRKRFDRAKELQERHDARNKELEEDRK